MPQQAHRWPARTGSTTSSASAWRRGVRRGMVRAVLRTTATAAGALRRAPAALRDVGLKGVPQAAQATYVPDPPF